MPTTNETVLADVDEARREVALFRYGVITDLALWPCSSPPLWRPPHPPSPPLLRQRPDTSRLTSLAAARTQAP